MKKRDRRESMRNILVVIGAGNPNGNTNRLSAAFIRGAKEAGHSVKKVVLDRNIQGCIGCGACQRNGHRCALNDGMQQLYPLFEQADTVVLTSPLYFWSISGRLKSFIDRLYAISTNDEYPKKETVLLMTAGSEEFYAFHQAVSFYRFYTSALEWKDQGMVLAGGCEGEIQHKTIPEKYLKEAYELGKGLK
jgi:multimeric flavodoxin WrbA